MCVIPFDGIWRLASLWVASWRGKDHISNVHQHISRKDPASYVMEMLIMNFLAED